jgi:hypothetical protein
MRRLAMTLAIVCCLLGVGLLALRAADEGPAPSPGPAARQAGPTVITSPTPTTRLYVKTVPQGAQVMLDGRPLGPSDGLFIVPPGTSRVRVEFEGGEPQERVVEIAAGRITRLELDFATPEAARPANGGGSATAREGLLAADGRLLLAASRVLRVPSLADVQAIGGLPTASKIDEALLRPLPANLVFDDVPLPEVLNRISEVAEIAISIDERALSAKGFDPAARVTVRPGGLPLGSAVSEIVRQQQLRWMCEGDEIVVTASGVDQEMVERVYRIDDLVTPNDPEGGRLLKFLSEASWPLETMPITSYRQLTFAPAVRVWTPETKIDEIVVQAPWWRQWRTARLLALLRQLRSTPVADRVPLSADGYWSDADSAAAARAALDTPLDRDVALDGRPLGDAIARLSQAAGVPIVFDSIGLAASPLLAKRVAVRGPTKGQTLAAVLDAILDGGLCFELARDRLTVSNRRWSSAAYYPVDDLLAAGQTFESLQSRIGSQGGPTWVIDGGVNCLAITRTTAGHRAVESVLRSLRKKPKHNEPKAPMQAEKPEPSPARAPWERELDRFVKRIRVEGRAGQHEAAASLRVLQPDKDDHEVYRKTQAQLIKSPFVFQKALREPGIAELPTLAGEGDRVGWLARHVQVAAPRDSDTIEVSLSGENADDVARMVYAITTVYLREVVHKERRERIERHRALEKTHEKAGERLGVARDALTNATEESDRERLRDDVTKLEEATKLLAAELDRAAEGISSIPDRVELVERARPSAVSR